MFDAPGKPEVVGGGVTETGRVVGVVVVGAGTVVGQAGGYPVAAGSYLALRFLGADGSSSVNLRRGAADNFTVKVAAISGTAKLLIDYRQEAN